MSLRGDKRRRINLTIEHATLKIQISNQRTVVLRYQAQPIRITNQLNKTERKKKFSKNKKRENVKSIDIKTRIIIVIEFPFGSYGKKLK